MVSIENIARPVGPQAKYNTARHSLGILRAVIVTCRYKISASYLRQKSLQDVIENALATVILSQPMLRVGIAGEDTKEPAFVHLKTIDMRRMIEWKDTSPGTTSTLLSQLEDGKEEANLFRSLEKHHELLWEDLTVKPGWKIVIHYDPHQLSALNANEKEVLLSFDISFSFHHAYADGRSGYIFHTDLQRALNTGTRPSELQDHILYLPLSPILPPSIEALIPFTLSWPFILRTIWSQLVYPILASSFLSRFLPAETDIPWTGAPIDASTSKVHIRTLFELDSETSQRILTQCRFHKTSLTGLLHALLARSLARYEKGRSFRSATPISLTDYAVADSSYTPGKTIHCLVTSLTCEHDVHSLSQLDSSDEAIWTFAETMTARLRAKTASLPRDDVVALAGQVSDWHEFFRGKFGKGREVSWEVSNLGSFSSPGVEVGQDGRRGWAIDRAVFTQGANATGAAMNVNVAGVGGKGIHATVSWQEGVVGEELVEGVVREVRAGLVLIGRS